MNQVIHFTNARILRRHQFVEEDLWIKGGQIVTPLAHADQTLDLGGRLVASGYIDLQVNGAFGYDFSSQPDVASKVAAQLPRYGVTAFLPTVVTNTPQMYRKLLPTLQPKPGGQWGAEILGIHLEGPFLNPDYAGAHLKEFVQGAPAGWKAVEDCYGSLAGVKLVTLAPEVGMPLIEEFTSRGIAVSLGHSGASYEMTLEAFAKGAVSVTHLFNAMAPFHHRKPGMAAAALLGAKRYYSLIADGVHVHNAALLLAWKTHPHGAFLISDATAAWQGHGKELALGPRTITADSVLKESQALAGSKVGLHQAVKKFKEATGCALEQALEAASWIPAQMLGLRTKGKLEVGYDADFIVLDDELEINACYVAGECSYSSSSSTAISS